jgi:hypothetical protein
MTPLVLAMFLSNAPLAPSQRVVAVEFKPLRVKRPRARFVQRRVTSPPGGDATPLVLSFADADVAYTDDGGTFELEPGQPVRSVWPTARTPWLCRDLDHDGAITSGRELFGSFTLTAHGLAKNGFDALAPLDANGDGVLDEKDPAFEELCVWRDGNSNRRTDPGELVSLREAGVVSLSLRDTLHVFCVTGACERERAAMVHAHGIGAVIDVHLALSTRNDAIAQRAQSSTVKQQ